jgi:predicted phosphodiesterase
MSKAKRRKRSTTQTILWVFSLFLVGSMVISLVVVSFPEPQAATPTLEATLPPAPPTATPLPSIVPTLPVMSATPSPAAPLIGPELPTGSPAATSTLTPTATITPLPTATPSSAQPAVTFAVVGDSRDNPKIYERVLDSVAASAALFLVHTGDLVNQGTESLWRDFEQTMAGFALPFYPVPGNHDGLVGKLGGYLAYSGAPAVHYSLDYGPLHLALADSHNGGVDAKELDWLRQDLSATDQPVRIVILHHPPFDPDGTDHIMAYGNEGFMSLMQQAEVDCVFAGHIHAFSQAERDGTLYVYTGGGGAPLYLEHPQAFYHYLLVTVEGDKVAIQVVKI